MINKNEKQYADLTQLKKSETKYADNPNNAIIETFENRFKDRDYEIVFNCPEFTTKCPVTDQPDFGGITIKYIPNERCIESKSLKLYLFSYRNYNTFHEDSVNRILDDIVKFVRPRKANIEGIFRPRGGISITVTATYKNPQESS